MDSNGPDQFLKTFVDLREEHLIGRETSSGSLVVLTVGCNAQDRT